MTLKGYTETEKKWIYSKSIIETSKRRARIMRTPFLFVP